MCPATWLISLVSNFYYIYKKNSCFVRPNMTMISTGWYSFNQHTRANKLTFQNNYRVFVIKRSGTWSWILICFITHGSVQGLMSGNYRSDLYVLPLLSQNVHWETQIHNQLYKFILHNEGILTWQYNLDLDTYQSTHLLLSLMLSEFYIKQS